MGKVPGTDTLSSCLLFPYGSDPSRPQDLPPTVSWGLCPMLSTFPALCLSAPDFSPAFFQKPDQIPSLSPFTAFLLTVMFHLW